MSKILFVYPNKEGYPIIPLGISVLSGVLKHYGHEVDLFDITFMMSKKQDHAAREKAGVVKKVDVEKYWGSGDNVDINKEFRKKILSFNPDLIAFSIVENNYGFAKKMFKIAKETAKSPVMVGGIFPTIAPEFFIEDDNVDIICRGEGEYAILELANRLAKGENITKISNLIVKSNGKVIKNGFSPYYDWEPLIYQDWEMFDKRHLMKPFDGKMWRAGYFEMSRGCPFSCTYCANPVYQDIFKCLGKYHREKPIDYVIKEIEHMKKKHSLEIIFFNDENFMMMGKDRFEEFCKKFKERINLPFFIQTRAETLIDEKKVKMLKEINCATVAIGIESGQEKIRREVLERQTPDYIFEKAFANCNKYKIRTTAYVMVGFPFETEEDILATASFCKKLNSESVGIAMFAPYYGTKLRKICIEQGFIEDRYYDHISMRNSSILKMPQLSQERLEELFYKFNDLVYGNKLKK